MVTAHACFIYEIARQVFVEIDLKVSIQHEAELFSKSLQFYILDISNYNLGIFQFLIIQPSLQAAIFDFQNQVMSYLGPLDQIKDIQQILGSNLIYFTQEYQESNIYILSPENICQLTVLDLGLNFQSPREDDQDEEQQDQNLMVEENNAELYMDNDGEDLQQNMYMQGLIEDDQQQHLLQYEEEPANYMLQDEQNETNVMLMDPH
jgi:hypothetical protein